MSHKKCHNGYKERSGYDENSEKRGLRPRGPDLEKEIKKDHKKRSKEALKHEKQRHHDVKKELHDERKHWKQLDSYAREVKFKDLEENGFYCKTLENACVQCNLEPTPGTSQDPDWICENCQDDLEREGEMQYSDLDIQDNVREVQEHRELVQDQVQIAPEPSSEISTESSSELIWRSLLTDEEWMKYLVEKKRMEKEKKEHIRKLKEEHQIWKQRQREDHEEFKRKQKEAHKEWKKRQKQEHDEWRRKLKTNHEEAKRKTKTKPEFVRKKEGDESPDSADSDDSEDEEDDEMHRHKIVPWRKNHEGGFIRSIRNMFHHAARNIYRATGAKRTWKYFKKKIIRRYLRRTYRNVSRQITSFLELFDTQVGNALILFGLLILGVFLGGYLYSHLHRID